jgi:TfoX/Sxy family transcriptional regulator of competence genes
MGKQKMASNLSFVEFVADQLHSNGNIRYKKMFGEYMVWVNEKPLLLICDDTVFVKKCDELIKYELPCGFPYSGAKEHFVLDAENGDVFCEIVSVAERATLVKSKTKKK